MSDEMWLGLLLCVIILAPFGRAILDRIASLVLALSRFCPNYFTEAERAEDELHNALHRRRDFELKADELKSRCELQQLENDRKVGLLSRLRMVRAGGLAQERLP